MTWHRKLEPNFDSLPAFHGLRKFDNGRLHLFVYALIPEFDAAKYSIAELCLKLQEEADKYLQKNYPEIAGNEDEIREILTEAINAQHRKNSESQPIIELSGEDNNTLQF